MNGNVVLINNTGLQGGVLMLISTQVKFKPGVNITFENNHAEDVGEAIFVESDLALYDANNPSTTRDCFYQFPSLSVNLSAGYSISFVNNSARNGGDHIYGASMMSYCIVSDNYVCSNEVQQFFSILMIIQFHQYHQIPHVFNCVINCVSVQNPVQISVHSPVHESRVHVLHHPDLTYMYSIYAVGDVILCNNRDLVPEMGVVSKNSPRLLYGFSGLVTAL